MSIARIRHVAIPQFAEREPAFIAWCKRPGCPVDIEPLRWEQTWGSSEHGSLNIMECLQAPRSSFMRSLQSMEYISPSRTTHLYREADVSQEETGRSTEQSRRGSFVIHLDRQPRTSRRREAQTGSRARSGSRSERTLDAVEHSRTLMEWWPFLIFHRGGLRIKVINNSRSIASRIFLMVLGLMMNERILTSPPQGPKPPQAALVKSQGW